MNPLLQPDLGAKVEWVGGRPPARPPSSAPLDAKTQATAYRQLDAALEQLAQSIAAEQLLADMRRLLGAIP